jgi:hypothetical protein
VRGAPRTIPHKPPSSENGQNGRMSGCMRLSSNTWESPPRMSDTRQTIANLRARATCQMRGEPESTENARIPAHEAIKVKSPATTPSPVATTYVWKYLWSGGSWRKR